MHASENLIDLAIFNSPFFENHAFLLFCVSVVHWTFLTRLYTCRAVTENEMRPYYSISIHLFKYDGNLARTIRLQDTMQCIIYAHSEFDILQGYKNCPCKKERKKQYILRTPKLRFQIIWNWPLSYHSTRVESLLRCEWRYIRPYYR